MTIFEVLGYGPIVACDEELGLLVTVNGAYFNLWVKEGRNRPVSIEQDQWVNTTCSSPGAPDSLYPDLWKAVRRGEKRLAEWITEDQEDEAV